MFKQSGSYAWLAMPTVSMNLISGCVSKNQPK